MSETNTTTTTNVPVAADVLPTDVTVTMYGAHKILADQGLSVRPQMLYTYGRKGYIPTVEADGKRTTVRHLNEWAEVYRGRKAERAAKIQNELEGK